VFYYNFDVNSRRHYETHCGLEESGAGPVFAKTLPRLTSTKRKRRWKRRCQTLFGSSPAKRRTNAASPICSRLSRTRSSIGISCINCSTRPSSCSFPICRYCFHVGTTSRCDVFLSLRLMFFLCQKRYFSSVILFRFLLTEKSKCFAGISSVTFSF